MKRALLLVASLVLSQLLLAQSPKAENIGIEIKNDKILFNYDLISTDTLKAQSVELYLIDEDYNIQIPKKISGDYGSKVLPGTNKKIEWDIYKDNLTVGQKVKPKIIVNGVKKGGANKALYSILVPGLGDYFVADHKDMFIKPYVRTITTLGIFGLGIYALVEREKEDVMGWVPKDHSYWHNNGEMVWGSIGYKYNNVFFSNDAEILLITGATLWIADVIWVYVKGLENDKLRVFSNYSFGIEQGCPVVKYSFKF